MNELSTRVRWRQKMIKTLRGRKIINVRIMTDEEMEGLGWYEKSVVLMLDDGASLFFSADDEGNNAGACFTTYADLPVLPVFS